jgi:hypothetical protein
VAWWFKKGSASAKRRFNSILKKAHRLLIKEGL